MAASPHSAEDVPVPDSSEEAHPPGFSPTPSARAIPRPTGFGTVEAAADDGEYEEFLRFVRGRRPAGRAFRGRDDDDDEDNGQRYGDRSNAGPPPSWDGSASSSFKDYAIRARLWLATTKTKPSARGPSLLRNLTGTPFDDLKYLAKDSRWMKSETNGEELIQMMDTKELYGEDAREEMLASLVRVTYGLRRAKGEDHRIFLSKWDNAVRKLSEHQIVLPPDYLGFLLTMALKLGSEETKLLLNFTQGRLTQKVVKEWLRVHETNLDLTKSASLRAPEKKSNTILLTEEDAILDYAEEPEDDGDLEIFLNAIHALDDEDEGPVPEDSGQVFDEDEVKEGLSAMIKSHGKGGGKRTFIAVNQAKKAKGLARGYGSGRFADRQFQKSESSSAGSNFREEPTRSPLKP